jgi:hypothetical protein
MIWLSLSRRLLLVLSGARQRPRSSFAVRRRDLDRPGHEPSPPGFKEVGQAQAATAPTGDETKAETPQAALAMGPLLALYEQLVAQNGALDGLLGMEKAAIQRPPPPYRERASGKSVDQLWVSN